MQAKDRIKLSVLGSCLAAVLFTGGCQKEQQKDAGISNGITVVINGGGKFPSFLAGVWRQKGTVPREFVISPDGRLTSAVIGMGLVRVVPNQETRIPLIEGGEGFFAPGPWTAYYDPATRNLSIGIEISSFQMEIGEQSVAGVIRESFEGPVSKSGGKWEAHYFALSEYHAFTQDGKEHVLMDGSIPEEQEMVFERIYIPQN